jgi:flagellar biosynthesis protein FliQ
MPKTILGKWSLGLIAAMPLLFFTGSSFANSLYKSVPAGNTILEDIADRPALALTLIAAMVSGISALITGLIAVTRQKERSPLVYIAIIIGALLMLFLAGEVLFPH